MGRPLRLLEPDGIYFITGRCLQARMLMRPDERVTAIIGGVLARAISRFSVDVFAVSFVSNHFHLIVRSANDKIPDFMQYLRCNIAKKVGAVRNWHGKFWDRRYDAEPPPPVPHEKFASHFATGPCHTLRGPPHPDKLRAACSLLRSTVHGPTSAPLGA